MENPKKLYGHQEWPPLTSVEKENINEGCSDSPEYYDPSAKSDVKGMLRRGEE